MQLILIGDSNSPRYHKILTISVIMMGRPKEISLVDSIRITVRLMVILTTPPRKAAAPIRAYVPDEILVRKKKI